MDKLQFDNYHKFLVSLGTVLMIVPLTLYHLLISGSYDILISQEEYDALSDISNQYVEMKSRLLFNAFKVAPYISVVLIIIGVILFFVGCFKWSKNQVYLDLMTETEAKVKKLELEKLTPPEISTKIEKEVGEVLKFEVCNDGVCSAINSVEKENRTRRSIIPKYKLAVYQAQEYVTNILGKDYDVKKYVRLRGVEYDLMALSKRGGENYIYEVKYITSGFNKGTIEGIRYIFQCVQQLNNEQEIKFVFCPVFCIESTEFEQVKEWVFSCLEEIGIKKENVLIIQE